MTNTSSKTLDPTDYPEATAELAQGIRQNMQQWLGWGLGFLKSAIAIPPTEAAKNSAVLSPRPIDIDSNENTRCAVLSFPLVFVEQFVVVNNHLTENTWLKFAMPLGEHLASESAALLVPPDVLLDARGLLGDRYDLLDYEQTDALICFSDWWKIWRNEIAEDPGRCWYAFGHYLAAHYYEEGWYEKTDPKYRDRIITITDYQIALIGGSTRALTAATFFNDGEVRGWNNRVEGLVSKVENLVSNWIH